MSPKPKGSETKAALRKPSPKKKPTPEKRLAKKSPSKKKPAKKPLSSRKLAQMVKPAPLKELTKKKLTSTKESPSQAYQRPGVPPDPLWDAISLTDIKVRLRLWYQTAQMPSPMSGFLEPLRVRSNGDGSGTAIFECSSSSLRFALEIPAATRGDKKKVKKVQDEGRDPNCPRHDSHQRLNRVGPNLVCPLCGVRYGKV